MSEYQFLSWRANDPRSIQGNRAAHSQDPVFTNTTLSKFSASIPRTSAELEGTPWAGHTIRIWLKCENLQRIGAFHATRHASASLRQFQQISQEQLQQKDMQVCHKNSTNITNLKARAKESL
ncbi:hypothetical protein FB45DRAFT_835377 [Roridomyces roridus]|uniref:Uncharacterized protein n=1 Tax=Roridomyces roridus TaxID=1738132 RepID=A0AAD7FMC9_9AGAR|nr:hypothetical protein FB45DRAFT_835377 [Roridomyces roridus]